MINFYWREPFFRHDQGKKFPQRLSSIIRGKQIKDYLSNTVIEKDINVYIKPLKWQLLKSGDYIDVLDDPIMAQGLKTRPDLNVIAMTVPHKEWLESFLKNKIIHIPHQHMNFERERRTRTEITTCGYVGANNAEQKNIAEGMRIALEKVGMKFIPLFTFETREDIINFYKSIDIQVIGNFGFLTDVPYYHQKKIVDAMSFGIPTVSEAKLGYRDVNDFYYKVKNLDELVAQVLELQKGWDAERLINEAEKYHISNIAKLYTQL